MQEAVASDASIPIAARVHLSHAVVETIALDAGVDLLHIKGPALLPGLRPPDRASSDVDVLVAPGHVETFEQALSRLGWERLSDYTSGSAFHHAANWFHENWGYVDVHAHWPGPAMGPNHVYTEFAAGDHRQEIAHVACRVPNRTAQILILVLHAARSQESVADLDLAWHAISEEEHDEVRAMAERLKAGTALAVGLGELDSVIGDRSAALWRHYSQGGSRVSEWRARLRAADTASERVQVLSSAVQVNRDHLRMELGHVPTRRDVTRRQWQRVRVLWREAFAGLRSTFRRPDRGPDR